MDFLQSGKTISSALNFISCVASFNLFDLTKIVKGNSKVIFYSCVSLISHLDLASAHRVDFSFLKTFSPFFCSISKEGPHNRAICLIRDINIEQHSRPFGIVIMPEWVFLCDLDFNDPILSEAIQAAYWHVFCIIGVFSQQRWPFLRRNGLGHLSVCVWQLDSFLVQIHRCCCRR